MEKEVIEFVDEMWERVDSLLATYTMPLDVEAKFIGLRTNIEGISSAIHGE